MNILSPNNLNPFLSLSTGIFAGLGTALSVVVVPAVLKSKDPLPVWRETYLRGSKLAVCSLIFSTATGLICYVSEDISADKKFWYLLSSALSFSVMPYTVAFMVPTNKALFAAKEDPSSSAEGRSLIQKWGKLQLVRTALGVAAFVINVYKIRT